jgi:hypothetical protein
VVQGREVRYVLTRILTNKLTTIGYNVLRNSALDIDDIDEDGNLIIEDDD